MELSPISASLGAMGSLPGKLGELLATRHWALRGVVMDEIEQLTNDLHTLQNFLVKLSNAQDPPMTARYWMKNVRELTYDLVDCVDQFVHADARAKIRRATRRNVITRLKINRLPERWKWRPWITNKISEFRTCAQEATQRYWRYRFDACACNPGYSPIGQDLPNIVLDPDDLVGIEGPMNQLERWLTSGDEQLKVVSIVGVAGIGKTTLAQKLWGKLHGQFECRAFVRAGQKPDMRGVIRSILSQVRRHQPPGPGDMHHLICDLREYLQDKRYFVIIDELWTTSVWDVFSRAFPEGNCCSRIIITTDIVEVALACCGYCPEHILKMESLSDDDSEKLLLQRMLVSENQQFDNVLPQIMRNCGGLPLAIIIVASILACQPEKLEQLGCMHDSFGANHTMEGFMGQILNISFNSLPRHLKTCLLYLSTYPEGFLLLKGDLVKQWVAEGFICVKEGEDMEEVAGSYFDELVSMGLIQAMDINYDYELSYTVHHMVLDCITYKSIEHNFVTVVDYSQTALPVTDKVRRLSLHFGSATYASTPRSTRLPQVRSLFFSGLFNCMPSFMVFKLLQVLILHFWCDTGRTSVNLSGICELFRLRYLQVTCNVVVKLPDQIEDMKNLQTLEINAEVWDLPPDIVRLSSLLHLRVQGGANLPDGIGSMKSLRTLMYFDLGNNFEDNIWGLAELTNLRDLHLTYSSLASGEHLKRNLMVLAATLRKLSNLKSLTLTASSAGTVVLFDDTGGMSSASVYLEKLELLPPICIFSRLPKWTRQLHKLRILEVAVRELLRDDIDSLTGLHFLTVFSLCIHTAPERRIVFNDGAFPVLKYFKFRCGVLCLGFMAGAMPNLRRLKLAFNMTIRDKYGDMLAGIEHLVNLQDITSQIGASTESVRRAVEAVFKDAIGKHPMCPRFSIQWVQPVEEEYLPSEKQHLRQEKYSPGENYGVLEKAGDMNKHADNKISQISDLPTTVASSSLKSVELSIKHHVLEKMLFDESAEPESLELSLLEDITTNFSNDHEIGRNRFGVVYKGNLPNGRIVVVKRLAIAIDDKVFLDGVDCLMSVKHRNIVRFLGYSANIQENVTKEGGKSICIGMHDRFLCFEYLCNGNLRMHLDDESLRFDWHMRYQVINGICQGLHYLHDNCITHLDLKLDNILFDDKMVPKIVDYGYSRLWNEEICPIVPRNIGGSLAYMATPEYFGGGPITLKSDIFSLGVIIMQIVFGQYELNYSSIPSVLESWSSRLESDASERHISTETCYQQVKVCLDIGISCMNHDPENRCITQDIIHRLAKNEIVELSVRSDVGNSYLEQMTVHCKEIFKPFATALLAPPVHHKILNKHLEQRIVISVWMQSDKARDLAIRLVERTKGVITVTVTSKSKNQLEVVGEDVDVVALVMLLRRKVGHAEIVTEDHVEVAENLAMGDEIEMIPKFGDWSEPSYFTGSGTNFKSFNTVDESGRSDDTGCTIS